MSECIFHFLEEKNMPSITKKKHTYLMMDGHDQEDMYVLKEGIVKVSIILCDGREFNITYIKDFDVISLLKDEINEFTNLNFEFVSKVIQLHFIVFQENCSLMR